MIPLTHREAKIVRMWKKKYCTKTRGVVETLVEKFSYEVMIIGDSRMCGIEETNCPEYKVTIYTDQFESFFAQHPKYNKAMDGALSKMCAYFGLDEVELR